MKDFSNTGIQLLNDKELGKLFEELIPRIQNQIVAAGFKKAGNIIMKQVKENFKARINNSGNLNLAQYFKVQPMKTKVGEKVGAVGSGKSDMSYLLRFLDYGTKERFYMSKRGVKHITGKLKATNFFADAVDATKDEAQKAVQQSIVDSFEKVVAKYNK